VAPTRKSLARETIVCEVCVVCTFSLPMAGWGGVMEWNCLNGRTEQHSEMEAPNERTKTSKRAMETAMTWRLTTFFCLTYDHYIVTFMLRFIKFLKLKVPNYF